MKGIAIITLLVLIYGTFTSCKHDIRAGTSTTPIPASTPVPQVNTAPANACVQVFEVKGNEVLQRLMSDLHPRFEMQVVFNHYSNNFTLVAICRHSINSEGKFVQN